MLLASLYAPSSSADGIVSPSAMAM